MASRAHPSRCSSATHARWVAARAADDAEPSSPDVEATEAAEDTTAGTESVEEVPVGERMSAAMAEFAEAGFPSDEDDAKDPIARTKAMNGAVDDLYALMDSEVEVLGQAFDLLEQLGVKGLEKPRSPRDKPEEPTKKKGDSEEGKAGDA